MLSYSPSSFLLGNYIVVLTLFRLGLLRTADRWGKQKAPLFKICHTYPKMMKLGTVINSVYDITNKSLSCDSYFVM